jgi:hypothetical protein
MGDVVYTSHVRVERVRGRHRRAEVPGATEPVEFGVHGAIARHYGVEPGSETERTATLDYIVAAADG